MKTKLDADELNLVSLAKEYSNERKARKLFEAMRWPGGKPICPHCGFDEVYKLTSKKDSKTKLRPGVYCCAACRKPFTATVGTVFEDSHVPMSKILMAIFILCNAKKSVSANQLSRMLRTTYRTAWFLAHRIRHAMATDIRKAKPLSNVCEADETFFSAGGDAKKKKLSSLWPVALVIERDGEARTRVIPSVTAKNIKITSFQFEGKTKAGKWTVFPLMLLQYGEFVYHSGHYWGIESQHESSSIGDSYFPYVLNNVTLNTQAITGYVLLQIPEDCRMDVLRFHALTDGGEIVENINLESVTNSLQTKIHDSWPMLTFRPAPTNSLNQLPVYPYEFLHKAYGVANFE
jgi:transposase-like protein